MLNKVEIKMSEYKNTNSQKYDNAKKNYQKYANELGIHKVNTQIFIEPSRN